MVHVYLNILFVYTCMTISVIMLEGEMHTQQKYEKLNLQYFVIY
jgi:hypothetical protein